MSYRSWIARGGNEAAAFEEEDRRLEKRLRDQDRAGSVNRLCGDYDPPWCSIYDKECLHDGQECDNRCMLEVYSFKDSDHASDWADWQCHQERDQ